MAKRQQTFQRAARKRKAQRALKAEIREQKAADSSADVETESKPAKSSKADEQAEATETSQD
jgi:hypothetical protein